MIFILAAFVLITILGMRYSRKGNNNFFDQSQTNCIRGFFVLIIFMNHFNSYLKPELNSFGDSTYIETIRQVGQMMVAPFLFFSGYGIYLSAQKKKNYIKEFPKRRIAKTYLFFALAIVIYLIYNLAMGTHYGLKTTLLAFTGWTSIGNSNWFMFAILFLYIATYISALLTGRKVSKKTMMLVFVATIAYIIFAKLKLKNEHWWYDTVLCYPFGMLFAAYYDRILSFFSKRRLLSALLALSVFVILFNISNHSTLFLVTYNLLSCSLCFLIARILFSLSIKSRILTFLGAYGFEIYILQRIPHSFFSSFLSGNPVLCFACSLLATIIISVLFKKLTDLLFRLLKFDSGKSKSVK